MKFTLAAFLIILFFLQIYSKDNYIKIKINNDIELIKLSDHSFIHISYSQIGQFGRVASNGLFIINKGKAFLFDTPTNDSLTKDLVKYIQNSLKVQVIGFVPNHWHVDCMGGLKYLQDKGIESYANELTCKIAKSNNLPVPSHSFKDSLELDLNGLKIFCGYFGSAHSLDNIVVWIPSEKILFAGCMVKELSSVNLGNTADGNQKEYPITIQKVLENFRDAKIVIPGHGQFGGIELLKHTLELSIKNKTN